MQSATPFDVLWLLNCITYVSIVAWYLVNGIKCEIKSGLRGKTEVKYKWLTDIENEILEKRKLLSKCVAELERLKVNGRMTRKTKRNRVEFLKVLVNGISVYSLTKLICKLKAEVRRKAKTRKKKLRNQKARELNSAFRKNQGQVFSKFKEIIEMDKENETPIYKEIQKERKFFQEADEVINFWINLWCKTDTGNPDAEWLVEYTRLFENEIPDVYTGDINLESIDITKAIKKKRNWSAPGPDLIVNFWLKRLSSLHETIRVLFMNIINGMCDVERWYCSGRTRLLEKPGLWKFDNTRPITCTNNMYKWFTSVLQNIYNDHKNNHGIMQMDQRGAKEKCSGTLENLLIDDMVLKDSRDNKRNLSCCWIDVRKAYDSLSHSWMKKMLEVHRFPVKLQKVLGKIMDAWNIVLFVPLEREDVMSEPIRVTNGVLQGDVISGSLFTLSLNPVSWELRRYPGYVLSKPIHSKITHSFFIDDLKTYSNSTNNMINMLSEIKSKMADGSLEWNAKKCNVLCMKRGKIDKSLEEVILKDEMKIKCLKSDENYKFLGVPENVLHDVDDIVSRLKLVVKQRASVIWTSPLSDFNKVVATNIFVHSSLEYFMWSEKFNIGDIREMDQSIRNTLNDVRAKYKLQVNSSLYLPRNRGGRGLKCLETTYKRTKVTAAMNLMTRKDPRMECVRKFEKRRVEKGRSSVLTDASRFAEEDFDVVFEALDNDFTVRYQKEGEDVSTSTKNVVKNVLKSNATSRLERSLCSSSWQGVILNTRKKDPDLNLNECFAWMTKWKDAPVNIINDFQSIFLQIVPTLTFAKFRTEPNITSTTCRVCSQGTENVKHLLSNCSKFVNKAFKRRHDRVFQLIMFKYLHKTNMISTVPAWYTKICIKPMYEREDIEVYWDIPEYSGMEDESVGEPLRPDGKIVDKKEKIILVLEMSVPWIENRKSKLEEKNAKYTDIVQNLKVDNPGYTVKQLTFIVDCMGGYSKDFIDNLKLLGFTRNDIQSIVPGIQKILITEANSVVSRFKILTAK